jgi:uncharacterized protein with PQ loop repeat
MTNNILAVGAIIGGIIGIAAYVPQVFHMIKVKSAKGISLLAYSSWLFGNLLLLIYAISIKDIPYTIVNSLYCTANILVIILTIKYNK